MIKRFLLFCAFSIVVFACATSDDEIVTATDSFDRGIMLTHITDNIIIPSYDEFSTKMNELKVAGITFTTTPNQVNLDALRSSWLAAYKEWQFVDLFNIGKAEELQFRFYMNVYPLSVEDVEENINTGNYDLNSVNNHDAQGFPALDYLLFGIGNTDDEILEKFTIASNHTKYKKYITDVLNQMETLTNQVVSDFKTNRNTFIQSTGNTTTSALNKLTNEYIFYYEKVLRANKFGIPAGIFSSTPLPEKVEAFYRKDISKYLALNALAAFKDFFEGKYKGDTSANQFSFKQYLEALDRADIAASISNQLALAEAQINVLNNDFTTQIGSDNSAMLKSYDELQKAVVLLKVDMVSAFDIRITFVDADGD